MFKEFLEEVVKKAFNPDLGLFKVHCSKGIVDTLKKLIVPATSPF